MATPDDRSRALGGRYGLRPSRSAKKPRSSATRWPRTDRKRSSRRSRTFCPSRGASTSASFPIAAVLLGFGVGMWLGMSKGDEVIAAGTSMVTAAAMSNVTQAMDALRRFVRVSGTIEGVGDAAASSRAARRRPSSPQFAGRRGASHLFFQVPAAAGAMGPADPAQVAARIRLGSYNHATTEIRIHPSLNAPNIPAFFIQSIIHHEYLHHSSGRITIGRFHSE